MDALVHPGQNLIEEEVDLLALHDELAPKGRQQRPCIVDAFTPQMY